MAAINRTTSQITPIISTLDPQEVYSDSPITAVGSLPSIEELEILPSSIPENILEILDQAPAFTGYDVGGMPVTTFETRPANLFFDAVLGEGNTVVPGEDLFAITMDHESVRLALEEDREIVVTTGDRTIDFFGSAVPLRDYFGSNEFKISSSEIRSMLDSQKLFISDALPLPFYLGLSEAMRQDGIVTLPGPIGLDELTGEHCKAFIAKVRANLTDFGLEPEEESVLQLNLYQLGSLIVKSEDYYLLTNPDGTIRTREVGDPDAIRIINTCGIRDIKKTRKSDDLLDNRAIMRKAFQSTLMAAQEGFLVVPAVGMGVWQGDPNLYWRAFLDAVICGASDLERIFVNPCHQATPGGMYAGKKGEEFQEILDGYRKSYAHDEKALANLNKIVNLYERKPDVIHLSQKLKKAFPERNVSLVNASDPDVTLGFAVGEYFNSRNWSTAIEENLAALGSMGLCYKTITKVHEHPERLIQT